MAFNPGDGFVASTGALTLDDALPMFVVERVQLQFSIAAAFVAAQVANNVLVLALSNGRILRIDLNKPEDIDDIDLPKKPQEIGVIRRMFLDPTASHLLVCTSLGENYYLHSQSRSPKTLGRLRGVSVESVAWNPALPTASTREILIGASDGNVYELFLEVASRRDVKHLKSLQKLPDGPVTGLWADFLRGRPDLRRVLVATQNRLLHLTGPVGSGSDGGSVYTRLFESEEPPSIQFPYTSAPTASALVVSPDPPEVELHEDESQQDRVFAWLSSHGVLHGKLLSSPAIPDLGRKVFAETKVFPDLRSSSASPASDPAPLSREGPDTFQAIALTQWHILQLVGTRVVATNRLTGAVVYDQVVLDPGQKPIGLSVDIQKNTFWLFTSDEIFEIVVRDEDRNIWRIMLQAQQFDRALRFAHTQSQKETVSTAHADFLVSKGNYMEAAAVYGRSNKAFEEVALAFVDHNQPDALRRFLLVKLATVKKASVMQRVMIASWLVEIFMAKLNSIDDTILTHADLAEDLNPAQSRQLLNAVRAEYRDFVTRFRYDLDRQTVYEVISAHGREEELLYFANAVGDHGYVLSYWVQRECWAEVLDVLKTQTDPDVFYRHSSVLMTHAAADLVDILMRHPDLKPRRLIPALLEYNKGAFSGPLHENQAIRYLQHVVYQIRSQDSAVHNTLVSIYASHPSREEAGLLRYLESQGDGPRYDPDFALRLCIHHHRTLSCVHIYTSMGQYLQAVDLALSHDEMELASVVADRPVSNPRLRKKLWLSVARKVISRSDGIKAAIDFLKKCDLLKIEDLIPFFPDFVVIDDFKEEICAALEDYSRSIDLLKREMDESSETAANIKLDIAALDRRYAIVEPGEKCYVCGMPLLSRQFFVFPCQHSFHSDCLGRRVLEQVGVGRGTRIRDLQVQITKGLVSGSKREQMIAELDSLVASACEFAIKRIDEPFITKDDNLNEWAL